MIEVLESQTLPDSGIRFAAPLPLHARMAALIASIRDELEPAECPVEHFFSQGVYSRVMHIPKGVVVVGKIHKTRNQLTMLAGEATIVDDDGEPQRVRAPHIWISEPGVQRAVIAHTPCCFMSTHGTELTDVDEIERVFIAQDMLEYQQFLLTNEKES